MYLSIGFFSTTHGMRYHHMACVPRKQALASVTLSYRCSFVKSLSKSVRRQPGENASTQHSSGRWLQISPCSLFRWFGSGMTRSRRCSKAGARCWMVVVIERVVEEETVTVDVTEAPSAVNLNGPEPTRMP
ncbi:hypothetical protein R1flu_010948 [Riccia fluitans]|uniref:Uncharacterized protein n=1 Tax=Riccia fluitans TaxID=41844 RepID=A0ABD1Z6F0_9MARC